MAKIEEPRIAETNRVTVKIALGNGRTYTRRWLTPMLFEACQAAGQRWIAEDLRRRKVRGRSRVSELSINVVRTGIMWGQKVRKGSKVKVLIRSFRWPTTRKGH